MAGARSRKVGGKRKSLLELKFTEGGVKSLPPVFVPSERQLRSAANEVGLEWKNGRLVAKKGKLTKKKYEEFKRILRKKMGLKGKPVTASEATKAAWLKEHHPEIYDDYLKGKYKTAAQAADMAFLKEEWPSLYNKVKEKDYEKAIQSPKVAELIDRYHTIEKVFNEEEAQTHKGHYPEVYKSIDEGKHETVKEAFYEERHLKRYYPEEYAEFERLVREKGLTPEKALEQILKFERKQKRRRKAKKSKA